MFTQRDSEHLLIGFDHSPNTLLGRIQHAVEYSLNEGKVVLTKEDVAQFYSAHPTRWAALETNLAALFVIMVRTGKVPPNWNQNLTRFCLYIFAKMYRWELRDVLPSVEKWLRPFLEHPEGTPIDTIQLLLLFHRALMEKQRPTLPAGSQIPESMGAQLTRECLLEPSVLPMALLDDKQWLEIVDINLHLGGTKAQLAASVKEILQHQLVQSRIEVKGIIRRRMAPLKEELMAASWHPKRVEAWLNAGGFDLLESMMGM